MRSPQILRYPWRESKATYSARHDVGRMPALKYHKTGRSIETLVNDMRVAEVRHGESMLLGEGLPLMQGDMPPMQEDAGL